MAQQTDHIGDTNKMVTMKLYTEEQLKEAFNCGRLYLGREGDTNFYHLIDKLTPIELPSDEEIDDEFNVGWSDYQNGCNYGAKWMRDKILNQNK